MSFPEAERIARTLPGYKKTGTARSERHLVQLDLASVNPRVLSALARLVSMISGWKGSSVAVDGGEPGRPWAFSLAIGETCNCYEKRRGAPLGDDYCCGKDTPTDDRTQFGCRLERPVQRKHGNHGHGGSMTGSTDWFQYGSLSDDLSTFSIDKASVLAALRSETRRLPCTLCPAFSWQRLESGVHALPDTVDLRADKRFRVKFSTLDPGTPVGIKLGESSLPLRISFFDRDHSEDLPHERQVPAVRYGEIAAQDVALAEIENVVGLPLKHPAYFKEVGVAPHTGVLLFGPPGNGKTMIAKAVAGEANAHLEFINGPEILSKWVGESGANLRRVFERAKALAPSIVLIDEIDSIAPTRDAQTQQHDISLISQLLVLLDGLEERGRVAVVATTNRIEAVDPAVRRPGRFDYHIEVKKPDIVGREAILQVHLVGVKVGDAIVLSALARETEGFSGADLAAVCREAGLIAIRRGLRLGHPPQAVLVLREDLSQAIRAMRGKRVTDAPPSRS